jgi:hypothetical protein
MSLRRKQQAMHLPALRRGALARLVRLRWILIVALLPLEVLGLLAVALQAYRLVRHDPVYFTPELAARYASPGDAARLLETALQSGDEALASELQGLRWPAALPSSPGIKFVMLLERTDRYLTYLYVDMRDYERYPQHLEEVRGRWVVVPADLAFYLHSGQWRQSFLALSITWWLLAGLVLGAVWWLRTSERGRAWLLRD